MLVETASYRVKIVMLRTRPEFTHPQPFSPRGPAAAGIESTARTAVGLMRMPSHCPAIHPVIASPQAKDLSSGPRVGPATAASFVRRFPNSESDSSPAGSE
ncbi:MAG: hypothetical protein AVDCRST_MAG59-5011 [uncultured Thermomicrobiales bacterium]|uniref:Uncharacterized protein n=1 Tax=uncultured Thermomicrobiales bacterium TaxID=1645740 RepID=A0A6J4VN53_9BACT|nr:MAG: hypothetical protein AVDCRST_MAG59-5011 [uncultured Thermomicrobiales bacterium]